MMKNFFQMNMVQKIILLCAIFIIINSITGVALAADRDVIIGFKKPVGPSEKALIQSQNGLIKKSFSLIPAISAKIPENNITKISRDPRVKYIEDDKIFEAAAVDEYSNSWGAQFIGSDITSSSGINGEGVKVAVLDTGIDCNHEDLKNNCNLGYFFNFYAYPNNISNATDDSIVSHGTHVSGIIAAEKNGIGVVGVAPNASLYAVKVLDKNGFTVTSIIIWGLEWAVQNHMQIATMSIQGPEYSQALEEAVNAAYYDNGLLLVAAAGNNKRGVLYPAAFDSVIAVTAIDENEQIASFSPSNDSRIELAAPGVNINSTIIDGYGILSGTSMAAPYVTGVAALILSTDFQDVNGDGIKNNKDVRIILQQTARDVGAPGKDNTYGYGIVDASNAVLGFPSKILLSRTRGSPIIDSRRTNLSKGNYSINMHSDNISGIGVSVYENGILRTDLLSVYNFTNTKDINKELIANENLQVVFTPLGIIGSTGYVKIKTL